MAARAQMRAALARAAPEQRVLDVGEHARARQSGMLAHAGAHARSRAASIACTSPRSRCCPALFDAGALRGAAGGDDRAARRLATSRVGTSGVHFVKTFVAPAAQLRALRARACDAAALLRYARVPYWTLLGAHEVLGDMRYDRQPALDFADIVVRGRCRDWIPPWTPPRADLLGDAWSKAVHK